jgi:sugar/nucleoside kinase (ribokinase family)
MYDLVSIGSVVKDIILVTDRGKIFKTPKDKLAPEWLGFELGEKIRADVIEETLGGVATNLAIGTKKLGLNSSLISTIGTDYEWISEKLEKNKISTNSLTIDKKRQTSSIILVDQKTGERVVLYNSTSGTVDLKKLGKIKTKWLSISSLTGNWSKQADQIVKYVAKNKTGLILLPSTSQIRDDFSSLRKLLRVSKILILNKNEALETMSVMKTRLPKGNNYVINYVIDLLHQLGPKIVCVTDGKKGAWTSDGKNIVHSPIKKVECIDQTGAGDAFAAGFLGFYLKKESMKKSLRAGINNSASVVQYIGTTKGLLTRAQLLSKI